MDDYGGLAKSSDTSYPASSSCEQPARSANDADLFSKPTNANPPVRQTIQIQPLIDPSTHSNNDCLETTNSSTITDHGHGSVPPNNHDRLSSEGKSKQVTRTGQSAQVNAPEVASLDIDLNSARNKRRRLSGSEELNLTSETSSEAWLVQLHEAAYGRPRRTTLARSNLIDECRTTGTETTSLPLSAQDPGHHPAKEQTTVTDASTPEAGSLEMPFTQRSPPSKNMLKLRADGKLSSPKSRNRVGGSSKKKRSNEKLELAGNHKVVVIQYGSNEESRNYIGHKIQFILSEGVKGRDFVAEAPAEPPQLAKTASSSPPKPTHPFFLGNAAVKQARGVRAVIESKRTSTSTVGSDSEHDSHISPMKVIENQRQPDPFSRSTDSRTSFVGRGPTGAFRNPGGLEPAWPAKDAMHIRGLEPIRDGTSVAHADRPKGQVKLKGSLVRIPSNEDIVLSLASQLRIGERRAMVESSNTPNVLRVPQREVITGTQLQVLSCREVSTRLHAYHHASEVDLGRPVRTTSNNAHPAVSRLFSDIPTSLTAFDRAQCESYSWVHKYAPKRAEEVLQPGREAILLRDWLRNLTIEATDPAGADGQPARASSASAKRPVRDDGGPQTAKRRKRRKRAELLDGFVVSSDDESNEMDELTGPEDENEDITRGSGFTQKRTVLRTGDIRESLKGAGAATKLSNAVLISGPHGCGKTAAVYAAAKELGFEVFELNPGSKRSGKDIMDKVGDMARNHLVHHASERGGRHEGGLMETDSTSHGSNIAQGRPITDSFAKMRGMAKRKALATHRDLKPKSKPDTKPKQHASPKQSLILLEEVDILFDEDRQFWATVLGLIAQSKRPVIMTCNDESLVPLNQMSLHAILRFTHPACDPAADYLLLLAASEGHILGRSAVLALYKSKDSDLRASITELSFWCQMAIGDKKGGLEWILERWPVANDSGDPDQRSRVVSKDTYLKGMGWFDRDNAYGQERSLKERNVELLLEAWWNWGIGTENLLRCENINAQSMEDPEARDDLGKASLRALKDCERLADAASATDLFGSPGLPTGYQVCWYPLIVETFVNMHRRYLILRSLKSQRKYVVISLKGTP